MERLRGELNKDQILFIRNMISYVQGAMTNNYPCARDIAIYGAETNLDIAKQCALVLPIFESLQKLCVLQPLLGKLDALCDATGEVNVDVLINIYHQHRHEIVSREPDEEIIARMFPIA